MQFIATSHFRNLNDTGQNISNGVCNIYGLFISNTSAGTAFVQIFDLPVASVVLGTTVPMLVVVVPITTGFVNLNFWDPGLFITNRLSAFSTTTAEGLTGSANGVFLNGIVN